MYREMLPEDRATDSLGALLDLTFAQEAVVYLRGRGFDDQTIVECLRDEFEIDLATAESIAHPNP